MDLKWHLPTLKSYLGWVPQEALKDTISRNISFGLDESEEKNIKNAALAAGVW